MLDNEAVQAAMTLARAGLSDQLEAFAQNTMDYLRKERELLFDGVGVPDITTDLDGRHALIVVRGYHYKEDLETLRHYIREYRPVLIGVDGGADALIEARHKPDLIVGDMDSVSDDALRCGAEIVVHAYRDGRAPGLERVRALGVEPVVFPATGTSEDVAMLLADDKGATLIVAVGTHVTLVEFLDKGRQGMASTFLTRLRVGGKLVDAKGVSRLYRARISALQPRAHGHRGAVGPRRRAVVDGRRSCPPAGPRRPHRRPVVVHPRSVRLIDFRYHIVSIVSIFLALAVGIVLGAGPLKGELGDTLNKEVAGLRQDKADLNSQLGEARAASEARDAYIAETNPIVLAGVLQDRRVALVVLPGSDAAVAESTAATLRSSGAAVVSTTSVADDWVTADEATGGLP